jgi:hypothetical protein
LAQKNTEVVLLVLQGYLAKTDEKTWFFAGEFVVKCVVNVVG